MLGCRSFSTNVISWSDLAIDATPNIGAVHPVSILGDEYLQVLLLKGFLHYLPQSKDRAGCYSNSMFDGPRAESLAAFFGALLTLHTTAYRTSTDLLVWACPAVEHTADALAPHVLRTQAIGRFSPEDEVAIADGATKEVPLLREGQIDKWT